jgi:hypothetical protein
VTSLPGFLLIAASCLFLHVALTTELLIDREEHAQWVLRLFARRPELRTSRVGAIGSAAFVTVIQLVMLAAVVQPDRIAGPPGALIAAVELVLAGVWVAYLFPRRTQNVGRL